MLSHKTQQLLYLHKLLHFAFPQEFLCRLALYSFTVKFLKMWTLQRGRRVVGFMVGYFWTWKANVLREVMGSPLFWRGGLWWSKTFCLLLSHHPVEEMKPGIICRARGSHFPCSSVYSGFPVTILHDLLYICEEKTTRCCFSNPSIQIFAHLNIFRPF